MEAFVCQICGFISINGDAPEKCPVCGAPKTSFDLKPGAITTPKDPKNLSELEKKHIPQITVVKKCGLIPEGCQDVHVKVGAIQHPMEEKHSIQHIDFYLDREFISRVILTAANLNPAAALHFKVEVGKLSVISFCNLHGAWINDADL